MYDQSGRYDEPLDVTLRPPKSGLASKYRATRAPQPKNRDSVAESDVSFGWVDDVDFGRTRKENPASPRRDLGKSRRGELSNWNGLEATNRDQENHYQRSIPYDNEVLRSKPPTGASRNGSGLSQKPPMPPKAQRNRPRESSGLYRESLLLDRHESREESWAGWRAMAMDKPGENGEGWGTLFGQMHLRWSGREQQKQLRPPGSLTLEDSPSARRTRSDADSDLDRRKRRWRVIALLVVVVLFVVAVAVVIPTVMLTRKDKDKAAPVPTYAVFEYEARSPNLTYEPEMNDTTSEIFIATAQDFCAGVLQNINNGNESTPELFGCELLELRNGSVIFVFQLAFLITGGVTGTPTDVQIKGLLRSTPGATGFFLLGAIAFQSESLNFTIRIITTEVSFTNVRCLNLSNPIMNGAIAYNGYRHNDTATVTCDTGYEVQGTATVTCTKQYTWSTLPNCTQITCVNYAVPANGMIDPPTISNHTYQANLTVTCDVGYDLEGNDTVVCMANGNWSESPTCNIKSCPNYTLPDNSQMNPETPELTYGTVYIVTCDEGYELSGNNNVTCLDTGMWSDVPNCDPVECPEFATPASSSIDPETLSGHTYLENITVTCDPGYEIDGHNVVTCMADGNWSMSPTCNITSCPNVTTPDNSVLDPDTPPLTFGSAYDVICDNGYEANGAIEVECLENSTWSPSPDCNIITCTDFPDVENSVMDPEITTGLTFNSSITVTCNEGYTLSTQNEIKCQSNKTWSASPTCDPVVCVDFVKPPYSGIENDMGTTGHTFTTVLTVKCDTGFNISGDSAVTCQSNGNWSSSPSCNEIICVDYTVPANAETEPSDISNHNFNTTLKITCKDGYEIDGATTVTCTENGTWTDSPSCTPVVCVDFVSPDNGVTDPLNTVNLPFNSTVVITCNEGYTLEGDDTVRCTANKSWSDSPTCEPIDCQVFLYPANSTQVDDMGLTSENSKKFDEDITVNCSEGFILVGPRTFSCDASGSWPTIECIEVDCEKTDIQKPHLSVANEADNFYMMQCEDGYELIGNETVSCIQGNWTDIPDCEIVSCGELDDPDNGIINSSGTDYGDSAELVCDPGYDGSGMFACQANGSWDGAPACTPVVCDEFKLNNGNISSSSSLPYRFTNEITIGCDDGYYADGNTVVTCEATAKWSDNTTCEPVKCSGSLDIENGATRPETTDGLTFGEMVDVECNNGFELNGPAQVECQATGALTEIPTCDIVNCPTFPFPDNSEMDQMPESSFGSNVTIGCKDGYVLDGPSVSTCNANKTWSEIGACEPITCNDVILPSDLQAADSTSMVTGVSFGVDVNISCPNNKLLVGNNQISCNPSGNWTINSECIETDCDVGSFEVPENGKISEANRTYLKVQCDMGYDLAGDAIVICENTVWSVSPICTIVSCVALAVPDNGMINSSGITYGQTATLACNEGYEAKNSEAFLCLATGNWNDTAECELTDCGEPSLPENADDITTSSNKYGTNQVNVSCVDGFESDNPTLVNCTASANWFGLPVCSPVKCETLDLPENSNIVEGSLNNSYFGDNVTLECSSGYEYASENEGIAQCLADKTWSAVPLCGRVACPELQAPENGRFTDDAVGKAYEDIIEVECNVGYNLTENGTIVCQANKTWSGSPHCEIVVCEVDPDIANGNIEVETPSEREFGDTADINCNTGYEIDVNATVTCAANASWVGVRNCSKIDCGNPVLPANAVDEAIVDTLYEATLNISCKSGYQSEGNTAIECTASGNWSLGPECVPLDCGNYSIPDNGEIVYEVGTTFNETVTFDCDEGYEIQGQAEITCQSDGNWTRGPTCELVDCGDIGNIENGVYDTSRPTTFNQAIEIECDDGYETLNGNTTICQATGNWSELPSCTPVVCPGIGPPDNGFFVDDDDDDGSFGDVEAVSCDPGFDIEGPTNITCTADREWSELPSCNPVDCGIFNDTFENGTIVNSTGTIFRSSILFACDVGFLLVGEDTIECLPSGSWDDPPYCEEISCIDPNIDSGSYSKVNGTLYQVICDEGHKLIGDGFIECHPDGSWDTIPVCDEVTCGEFTEDFPNGEIVLTGKSYGDNATFLCNEGYNLNGPELSTCNENGDWEAGPSCDAVDCGVAPNPENGIYLLADNADTTFNTTLEVSCNAGYIQNGSESITCQESGNWTGGSSCLPIDCGNITVIGEAKSITYTNGTGYGSTATVECQDGFILVGEESANCTATSTDIFWTSPQFLCSSLGNISFTSAEYEFAVGGVGVLVCDVQNADNWTTLLLSNDKGVIIANVSRTEDGTMTTTVSDRVKITDNFVMASDSASLEVELSPLECDDAGEYTCGVGIFSDGIGQDVNYVRTIVTVTDDAETPDITVSEIPSYNASVTISCESGLGQNTSGDAIATLEIQRKLKDESEFTPLTPDFENLTDVDCNVRGFVQYSFLADETSDQAEVKCVTDTGTAMLESDTVTIDVPSAFTCDEVPVVDFGSVVNATSADDQVLEVICAEGYENLGDANITCTISGWIGEPNCSLIDCGPPSTFDNLVLATDTNLTTYNSIISGSCEEGYNHVQIFGEDDYIVCEEDGEWNNSFSCEAIVCDNYTEPSSGRITYTNGTTFGSIVMIECDEGYNLLKNESTAICDRFGEWVKVEAAEDDFDLPTCTVIGGLTIDSEIYSLAPGDDVTVTCTLSNTPEWSRVGLFKAEDEEEGASPLAAVDQTSDNDFSTSSSDGVEILSTSYYYSDNASLSVQLTNVSCESNGNYFCGALKGNTSDPTDANSLTADASVVVISEPERPELADFDTDLQENDNVTLTCRGYVGQDSNGDARAQLDVQIKYSDDDNFVTVGNDIEPSITRSDCQIENTKNVSVTVDSSYDGAVVRCLTTEGSDELVSINATLKVGSAMMTTITPPSTTTISSTSPVSNFTCDEVPVVDFGSVVNATSADVQVLEVICSEGYENFGDDNFTCTISGWNGEPNCSLIDCGPPSTFDNLVLATTIPTTYNSIIPGSCEDGYLPERIFGEENYIICEEDGEWNNSFSCEAIVCDNYTEPSSGRITYTNGTTLGSIVMIECDEGYNLIKNESTAICDGFGEWVKVEAAEDDFDLPTCTAIGGLTIDSEIYSLTPMDDLTITCSLSDTPEWSRVGLFKAEDEEEGFSPLAVVDQTSDNDFSTSVSDGVAILSTSYYYSDNASLSVQLTNVSCESNGIYFCGALKGNISDPSDANSLTARASVVVISEPEEPVLESSNTDLQENDIVTLTCRGNVGQDSNGEAKARLDVQIKYSDNDSFVTVGNDIEPDMTRSDCQIEYTKNVNVTVDSSYDGAVVRCLTTEGSDELVSNNATLKVTPETSEVVFTLEARDDDAVLDPAWQDQTSPEFMEEETIFCNGVLKQLDDSSLSGQGFECEVQAFRSGSVIVIFNIIVIIQFNVNVPNSDVVTDALTSTPDASLTTVSIGSFTINKSSVTVTSVTVDGENATTTSPLPTTTTTTITTSVPATAPVFVTPNPSIEPISIDEDIDEGMTIITINATDADGDTLEYSILTQIPNTPAFQLDSTTGDLKTPANLDAETTLQFNFTFRVTDGNNPVDSDLLTVNINDVNEFSPEFNPSSYSTIVAHSALTGTTVETVTATDEDVTAILTYSIISGNNGNAFAISDEGVITTAGSLSSGSSYTLTIQVSDGANTDDATVSIDVPAGAPVFSTPDSTTEPESIPEDFGSGKSIITIDATDANGDVLTYSILSQIPNSPPFELESGSGTLKTPANLDAETSLQFNFTFSVTDGTITVDSVLFIVNIEDVNEYSPEFLLTLYSATILNPAPAGTAVTNVTATDEDVTASVSYSFVSGNDESLFAISDNGEITTAASSLAPGIYNLTVQASDGEKTDDATVSVTVNGANRNAEVSFATPSSKLTIGESDSLDITFEEAEGWTKISVTKTLEGVKTSVANITEDNSVFASDHVSLSDDSVFNSSSGNAIIDFDPVQCDDNGTYGVVLEFEDGTSTEATTEVTTAYPAWVKLEMPVQMREDRWVLPIKCEAAYHTSDSSSFTWLKKHDDESTFEPFSPTDLVEKAVEFRSNVTTLDGFPCVYHVIEDFDLNTTDTEKWNKTEFKCALDYGTDQAVESDTGVILLVPKSICEGQEVGGEVQNYLECTKKVRCNGDVPEWSYISETDCETGTCWVGPNNDDCVNETLTTTETTPAPGTPSMACTEEVRNKKNMIVSVICNLTNAYISLTELNTSTVMIVGRDYGNIVFDSSTAELVAESENEYTFVNEPIEAIISPTRLKIDTNLTDCVITGDYVVKYNGNVTIEDDATLIVEADPVTPYLNTKPETFYKGQSVTIECTGNVGSPDDNKGTLSLKYQAPMTDSWVVQEGGMTENADDTDTCGDIETETHEIEVTEALDGYKYVCEMSTSDGQILISEEIEVDVVEPVLQFGDAKTSVPIEDSVTVECTWDTSIINASANILRSTRQSNNEEVVLAYEHTSGTVTSSVMGISGVFQAGDSVSPNNLSMTIDQVGCDDEALYSCNLLVDGELIAEDRNNISVTKSPDIPVLTLPSELLINAPTRYGEPLECGGMVGYPPMHLEVESYNSASQSFEAFNMGEQVEDGTPEIEDCSAVANVSYRSITFDSSWNGTEFRCAVYDDDDQLVTASASQTLLLLEDICTGDNDGYYYHPYDCHAYIWCHTMGQLAVNTCNMNCPNIPSYNSTVTCLSCDC